ncbi:tripartite tricarboxylate transporter permease [Alphaproteobacteria bacterium KMM 3653]|uniref:Tripartite tricarboxylate transporter permease n=1 Tax=Harenicola maris TaxID=2841044 RepID=A0AAP2CSB5_9RHOB|nr:tripartite tricarboxylate transporter permease [Harenicola maris]
MIDSLLSLFGAVVDIAFSIRIIDVMWATLLGICVGALPGLTATLGVALMTTLTFDLEPERAILILISMYIGAIYGGSRSAILLNIPGTPANAATSLDGYALARAGKAGPAMAVATLGSFWGSLVGMVALALIAPTLAEFALGFGAYEFFWLAVFGVLVSGQLTALDDPIKGWIAGFLGLLVAMVGQEGIHAVPRFSYGSGDLAGGIGLLPAMVGAFGFAEILSVMRQANYEVVANKVGRVLSGIGDGLRYWRTAIRSGIIGTFMGLIPGVGEDMGSWASYAAARARSKEREKFGKGSTEGLLAAETGNNAAVPGALIPVLTLGVPGSAPAAVLLAAMVIHGVRPGPLIMIEAPDFVFSVVGMVFMATLAMAVFGLLLTRPLLQVLRVRREVLMPIIFVLCTVGAFAIASRMFDVYVMLFFGIAGFILRELKFPMAPLILGIVLGDILDKNLRRGLVLSDGELTPFLTRPISAVLWVTALGFILLSMPAVRRWIGGLWGRGEAAVQTAPTSPAKASAPDSIAALVLFAFAALALIESLRMEGLSHLDINPFTAPGVVPAMVSFALLLCTAAFLLRNLRRGGFAGIGRETFRIDWADGAVRRVALTLGLTLTFALGMIGHLPFAIAASLFVFAFLVLLDRRTLPGLGDIQARPLIFAAVLSLVVGFGVQALFSEVFLVRLP